MERKLEAKPLLFAVFIIAICGIIYELIIGGTSTYLLGNSIKQFSITIGLYMSAMGVGSYFSKHLTKQLFDRFALIEILIGLVGGVSALVLFAAYAHTRLYVAVMYAIIIIIGILVGLEIPILTRIIEEHNQELRITLANVLSFDYIGALIGSVGFPILLFPHLGFIKTSFLVGCINALVAGMIIYKYKDFIEKIRTFQLIFWVVLFLLTVGFIYGNTAADAIEQNLYRDQIIYSEQTTYQKIVVTRHRDDIRLFLDGNIQFSTMDEYRYHEALIHPIMSLTPKHENILILGGGDGLAIKQLEKYNGIQRIVMVDIDEKMVEFCRTNPLMKEINGGALDDPKLEIINTDAYKYLESTEEQFDVIIIDLPDPNNESLNKLYTNVFYRLVGNHLTEDGMFITQSTSPYYAKEAFWSINKTIKSENFYVVPFRTQVPSFGQWGFQLASKRPFDIKDINISVDTDYLQEDMLASLFLFPKDEQVNLDEIEINKISKPVLLLYYEKTASRF